jgi:hypothetical protein
MARPARGGILFPSEEAGPVRSRDPKTGKSPVPPSGRFDLRRFLQRHDLTPRRLASALQVSEQYLQAALAGQGDLTARDRQACQTLARRLLAARAAEQLELPFAEPPHTFSREFAQSRARQAARKRRKKG